VIVSFVQSFVLIRRFKPDVVIGTGGYVCGPVLTMASWLGIPVVVHESNSYPGVTTRLLSRRATVVFTAFADTAARLPRQDNVMLVGTPVRSSLGKRSREDGRQFFGLDSARKTVLIFGGSLGAASINAAVQRSLIGEARRRGFQVIWQTGNGVSLAADMMQGAGWAGPFIDDMDYAYAAADVVVCRAGAATIAELTRLGKPAILVPYPHAAADHQTVNAQSLANAGAAEMIPDAEVEERLTREVVALLGDDARLAKMTDASAALSQPDAGAVIARTVLELIP
jgi:UDP-N-acetylglucosamine--N-acetylmuramyl-(pentapeptide) pyrophosphoryl-undecaprenol N-acetylglucosamine transferase